MGSRKTSRVQSRLRKRPYHYHTQERLNKTEYRRRMNGVTGTIQLTPRFLCDNIICITEIDYGTTIPLRRFYQNI